MSSSVDNNSPKPPVLNGANSGTSPQINAVGDVNDRTKSVAVASLQALSATPAASPKSLLDRVKLMPILGDIIRFFERMGAAIRKFFTRKPDAANAAIVKPPQVSPTPTPPAAPAPRIDPPKVDASPRIDTPPKKDEAAPATGAQPQATPALRIDTGTPPGGAPLGIEIDSPGAMVQEPISPVPSPTTVSRSTALPAKDEKVKQMEAEQKEKLRKQEAQWQRLKEQEAQLEKLQASITEKLQAFRKNQPILKDLSASINGIGNIGNSCYINSGLQLLFAIPNLMKSINTPIQQQPKESLGLFKQRQVRQMALQLVALAYQNQDVAKGLTSIDDAMRLLRSAIRIDAKPEERIDVQDDGDVPIAALLDALNLGFQSYERRDFVVNGVSRHLNLSSMFEVALRLSLREDTNLQEMIDQYFTMQIAEPYSPELDGVRLKDKIKNLQKVLLSNIPEFLVIQNKRFDNDGQKVIHPADVSKDGRVNLTRAFDPELLAPGQQVEYQVAGFQIHRGEGLAGGHYIAYRLCADGEWRCFNDSQVQVVSKEEAFKEMALATSLSFTKIKS